MDKGFLQITHSSTKSSKVGLKLVKNLQNTPPVWGSARSSVGVKTFRLKSFVYQELSRSKELPWSIPQELVDIFRTQIVGLIFKNKSYNIPNSIDIWILKGRVTS